MRVARFLLIIAVLFLPPLAVSAATVSGSQQLVAAGAKPAAIAGGLRWAEGPVWIAHRNYLLFSDVPANRIYAWSRGSNALVFLEPSGGEITAGFREPGSNGLKPGPPGSIIMADQGNRGVALLNLRTHSKRFLVQRYRGKRLNSPNDVAVAADGAIWFTDPPYGLEGIDASPLKEQDANGVYRLAPNGRITRVEARLAFPNGLAFSPDGRTLYVSNSDPKNPVIVAYRLDARYRVLTRKVFADFSGGVRDGKPGLPDGMTVDERGNLWATGPGGIHIFAPSGRELGLISHDKAISNCAFGGADGRTLFMTATDQVLALSTKVRGARTRMPATSIVSQQ